VLIVISACAPAATACAALSPAPVTATAAASASTGVGSSTSNGHVPGALDCNAIGDDRPSGDFLVVLDAVALPDPTRTAALGISRQPNPVEPQQTFFAKTGLGIRVGADWSLTVPAEAVDHLRIGWGSPGTPGTVVHPPTCTLPPSATGWQWFPGGYWVDEPGCYPVEVHSAGTVQQVQVGVGAPCPGQTPPVTA
jgi:hypothetical protein